MLNGLPKNFYKKNLQNDVRILDSIIITTESLANTLYSFILSTQKKKFYIASISKWNIQH